MTKNTITTGTAATAALLLSISGCASSPERPTQELIRAEKSIEIAEQSGAREYGRDALGRARDKQKNAEIAAERGDEEIALRLAREAEIDAELAVAQSNRGKAESSLAEIQNSIETLRQEIARANQ
jgi:hypothetical protein